MGTIRMQRVMLVALACMATLGIVHRGLGQCPSAWRTGGGIPGVDGVVSAMTRWDPDGAGPQGDVLVVSGGFSIAGNAPAHNTATWDGASWQAFAGGAAASDFIGPLIVLNGDLIAAGSIQPANGPATNIAQWTGTGWTSLAGGVTGFVYDFPGISNLVIFNGDLIAGGVFAHAGGVLSNYVARWDGASWHALGTGLGGLNPAVSDLAVVNGDLIVGGRFSTAGGVPAYGIARWDGTNWHGYGSDPDDIISAVREFDHGLIAAGHFDFGNDQTYVGIVRRTGVSWTPMGADPEIGDVASLDVIGGVLYATGGNEFVLRGTAPNGVVQGNGASWVPACGGIAGQVSSIAEFGGELVFAGSLHHYHLSGSVLACDGTRLHVLGQGFNSTVRTLSTINGELIVGGSFTNAAHIAANGIVRWDGAQWFAYGTGLPDVWTAAPFENQIVAGGTFETVGNDYFYNVATWNGSDWQAMGYGLPFGTVKSLAVFQNQLIAGGDFGFIFQHLILGIAAWDGAEWRPIGGGVGGEVRAMTIFNDELIAAGAFTSAGGVPVSSIARWDGRHWRSLGNATAAGTVSIHALCVANGHLIVAGNFATIGGVACKSMAVWDNVSWSQFGTGPTGIVDVVKALAIYDGEVIAAGRNEGGVAATSVGIVRYDGTAWRPLGTGIRDYGVHALTVYDGELYAGTDSFRAGGVIAPYLARWGPTCARGDMDCNGTIDAGDIPLFVQTLLDPAAQRDCVRYLANLNRDVDANGVSRIDGQDIAPFVTCIIGGCS